MSYRAVAAAVLVLMNARAAGAETMFASHPPMRPLPTPSSRAMTKGPGYFVDAAKGDDKADGSAKHPWKTLGRSVQALKAGDTLYLHGGVYFEAVTVSLAGTAAAPITIRSAPGELAILDGGLREFFESPKTAWEPFPGGAPDEYQSTNTYSIGAESEEGRSVWVLGNFADSMIPLHGYRYEADIRTDNQYWQVQDEYGANSLYLGPGVWFDWKTHRIHVRLAHSTLKSQGAANYRGETDPRKIPLVIGIDRSPLQIAKAKHLRFQDLVMRGAAKHTVDIAESDDIELDGVTIYGGSPALYVRSTNHFRLVRSALRGLAAPWSSRASMKYRGNSPYLFIASSKAPQSHDWELAYDEFTDSHDGLIIDSIQTLRFHHNRVDNFNDDGLYLTVPPRDSVPEDIQIYENYFTRVLTTLAFAQDRAKANTIGSGVYVFRNIFDLREGTYGWIPPDPATDEKSQALQRSTLCGDHGAPTWEPLFFYNNTVITADDAWKNLYGGTIGSMGTNGTKRRVFDNMFLQIEGAPGLAFIGTDNDDIQIDGNLLWGVHFGPQFQGDFFDMFRTSKTFETSKRVYPPGWGAHDVFVNPKLVDLENQDLRLQNGSPAIDAGVPIPTSWPDPLRKSDKGVPDIGALPFGVPMLRVGPSASAP